MIMNNFLGVKVFTSAYLPKKPVEVGTNLHDYPFGKGKHRSKRMQKKINKRHTSSMIIEVEQAFMINGQYFVSPSIMKALESNLASLNLS